MLVACAGQAPQTQSEYRREQLAQSHQRGADALLRGEEGRALRHYQAALDHARATGNQEAIAVNLLNVAALLHRAGESSAARDRLLRVIEHEPAFGPDYVGRAEARLALIELQAGRADEAAYRSARAEELCKQCQWRPALLNVQAAIMARNGDAGAAEGKAREALAAASSANDAREQASAWRTLADLAGAAGRGEEARKAWAAALDIDLRIEAPERVALDLIGRARLELKLGDRAAARSYARRAAEVAEGGRLAALLTEARALVREAE
jgi:tetratricopeptide (TPR) repeat protein